MNISYFKNQDLSFNAGMTRKIKNEIKYCDIQKISEYMSKEGIKNDFKGNKTIAWSTLKCMQLIQTLNKLYNLKLDLPKGIFVEDFYKLNGVNTNAFGFVNYAPTNLYKDTSQIVSEQTIFFNEFKDNHIWSDIDSLADNDYSKGLQTTDFFLEKFIHEFMHVLHEQNLILRIGGYKLIELLQSMNRPENIKAFRTKYAVDFKRICDYAATNPLEAVACDMSKQTIDNIDKNSLSPNQNYISSSPYTKQTFLFSFFRKQNDTILRKIWNGKLLFD